MPAKDVPSAATLRERPGAAVEKRKWLTYHDKDCGSLYGMLPLMLGMPMSLTDHVDRNPKVTLLRGRIGYVHGWLEDDGELAEYQEGHRILKKLPKVVFVKFPDAKWRMPGIQEDGVYPITPCARQWFLDRNRKKPMLDVKRKQLPLAPAFAITAHASQGQTLSKGAIVDLQLGRGISIIASYVAITRVETKVQLLIYRPFYREPFMRGAPEGPTLLLRKLRGEQIDWKRIESLHTPQGICASCKKMKYKDEFRLGQWKKEERACRECQDAQKTEVDISCSKCKRMLPHSCVSASTNLAWEDRKCKMCSQGEHEKFLCTICHTLKTDGRTAPWNAETCQT